MAVNHRARLLPEASATVRLKSILLSRPIIRIERTGEGVGLDLNSGITKAAAKAAATTLVIISCCSPLVKPTAQIPSVPGFSPQAAATSLRAKVSCPNTLSSFGSAASTRPVCFWLLTLVTTAGTLRGARRFMRAFILLPCGILRQSVSSCRCGTIKSN